MPAKRCEIPYGVTSRITSNALLKEKFMKLLLALCIVALLLPSAAFAQKEMSMNVKEKENLNNFFSNFSAVNLSSFKKGCLTDEQMLDFAESHCISRESENFKTVNKGYDIVVPAKDIDRITEKYFGEKIKNHKLKEYIFGMASGEAYIFSQVNRLIALDNGDFRAEGTIYYAGSGEILDEHGTPESWKKADIDVLVGGTFLGIIRKVKTDKERYILLEYDMVKEQ
jgi:hypothetical protein